MATAIEIQQLQQYILKIACLLMSGTNTVTYLNDISNEMETKWSVCVCKRRDSSEQF